LVIFDYFFSINEFYFKSKLKFFFYFFLDFRSWKASDEDRTIYQENDEYWTESYLGRPIQRHQMIEKTKNNEVLLYNNDSKIYYKLSDTKISYGDSLNSKFKYLYNGTWSKNKTGSSSNKSSSNSNRHNHDSGYNSAFSTSKQKSIGLEFSESVQKTIDNKKITYKLFDLISSSEIINNQFEGPFGNKKSNYYFIFFCVCE
jgi:hypothetical protein